MVVERVRRQIPIPELYGFTDDERIWCNWGPCDNPASSLHTQVECFASRRLSSHSERPARPECPECRRLAFCSERCADYYEHSHEPGRYGRLSPGVNRRFA
jgi:hypothetical protein